MSLGETSAGGAADLNSLEGGTVFQAAADIVNNLSQGGTHGNFDQAGILDAAGERESLGAGAAFSSNGAEPLSTLKHNFGYVCKGLNIVEDGGLFHQGLFNGAGRLYTGHAAVALNGSGKSRTLAADKCTCAVVDVQAEVEAGTQNIVTQNSLFFKNLNGNFKSGNRHGVLSTDIDVALIGANSISCNHHALDELEGIALHNGAVHKCAGVALVTVADNVALGFLLAGNLLPLASCGETAAATAAQTALVNFIYYILRAHFKQSLTQSLEAAVCQILVQRREIQLAAVFQNNAGLLCHKGNFTGLNIAVLLVVVQQTFNNIVTNNRVFNDFLAVIHLNLDVLDNLVTLLDSDQRSQLAEALAACLLYAHMLFIFVMGGKLQRNTGLVI